MVCVIEMKFVCTLTLILLSRWLLKGCYRVSRKSKYLHQGVRSTTSITCRCEWLIRFMGVIKSHHNNTDSVVITSVSPIHYNTCDPTYSGQLVLYRTRSGDYKRYGDEVIREIMVPISINPFVI